MFLLRLLNFVIFHPKKKILISVVCYIFFFNLPRHSPDSFEFLDSFNFFATFFTNAWSFPPFYNDVWRVASWTEYSLLAEMFKICAMVRKSFNTGQNIFLQSEDFKKLFFALKVPRGHEEICFQQNNFLIEDVFTGLSELLRTLGCLCFFPEVFSTSNFEPFV